MSLRDRDQDNKQYGVPVFKTGSFGTTTIEKATIKLIQGISTGMKEGKLQGSIHVHDYLHQTPLSEIASKMNAAWDIETVEMLMKAIHHHCFDSLKPLLPKLQNKLDTSSQGVYAGLVQTPSSKYLVYIGSSWGVFGLRHRIFDSHLNIKYRASTPNKALYKAMENCKATHFIRLAEYSSFNKSAQIVLTEAVCMVLFGTLDHTALRAIRSRKLPIVTWDRGLNRSNPLAEGPSRSLGIDTVLYMRLRTLEKCKKTSSFHVVFHRGPQINERTPSEEFRFFLFEQAFNIPLSLARKWNLENDLEIDVTWHVREDMYHLRWASQATKEDNGSRVAIMLSKRVNGHTEFFWLGSNGVQAIKVANSLYNFLQGKMVGNPDYRWEASRKYFFGCPIVKPPKEQKPLVIKDRTQKRKKVDEPLDFVWFDGKRQEETAPEEIVARREQNRGAIRVSRICRVSSNLDAENRSPGNSAGQIIEDEEDVNIATDKAIERAEKNSAWEDQAAFNEWFLAMEKKYLEPYHDELRQQDVILYPSKDIS